MLCMIFGPLIFLFFVRILGVSPSDIFGNSGNSYYND